MKNSADLGGCYPPRPSASVDNTLLDRQNSAYPTQPNSIIAKYSPSKEKNKKKYCLKQLEHMRLVKTWCLQHVCEICITTATQVVKYFAKANNAFTIFLHWRHGRFLVYQLQTVSLFSNWDCKVAKRISSSSSSSSSVTSPFSTTRLDSAERSTVNCSDSAPHEDDVLRDDSKSEEFFHWIKRW